MRTLKYAHAFEVVRELPTSLQGLRTLAYNFRWTWHPETRALFHDIDRDLWEAVEHNPVELISQLTPQALKRLETDELFIARLENCLRDLHDYLGSETWYQRTFPDAGDKVRIAYFCAEFGLNECLPIYSGGLGLLAGDHLKAASDLGIPLVGVGLLYARGYFRQFLTHDGWQQEHYPGYDFYRMPLSLVRGEDDAPLRISVEFPDQSVTCQVWKAIVGRLELFLLDSNLLENAARDQGITDTLYGGDEEMRIRQEMVLGIGGFKALTAMGKSPTVCHMNEGHAAFLSLERIRHFIEETGTDFRTARQAVVAGNVFTTHTPVPAGFDIFARPLLERYLSRVVQELDMPIDRLMEMGRIRSADTDEPFNMAVLAMENANYVNGVSKLHAEVSRGMFQDRHPDYPVDEVPIEAITNGVHMMSWISDRMVHLLDRHIGQSWRDDPTNPEVWAAVADIPDQDLWDMRENARGDFVRFARRHMRRIQERNNAAPADQTVVNQVLDPRILTIGFARRFATYKRASLLFRDPDRLRRLLHHTDRPMQFVFAGKSHPRDEGGKRLIQEIVQFSQAEGARSRIVFLEDYDINVARNMVQGVDLWLNNPRRPMEASGTSGMKVVANGGLNCSVLDGWWAEGFDRTWGWAIGQGRTNADENRQDEIDSQSLYYLLENEIGPVFYHRLDGGVPKRWIEMMRASMRNLTPRFSTNRMVREYTTRFYVPSGLAYSDRVANKQAKAKELLEWRDSLEQAWPQVQILSVTDDVDKKNVVGSDFNVTAMIRLGTLRPEQVRAQVLVGHVGMNRELDHLQVFDLTFVQSEGEDHIFRGVVPCDQPGLRGYRVRVVPGDTELKIPAELPLCTWEPGSE
ncbi:MAG: alpha-glucan family phosphorylase [Fimbriimonadaceae bacterium]|nr:alpha-glucan family phosphorylase [Fimbriimonadaceae bacterium]